MNARMLGLSALLISGLLSGCATAPQPTANQSEAKPNATQCESKSTQDDSKKVVKFTIGGDGPLIPARPLSDKERKAQFDAACMRVCDTRTALASVILRSCKQGVPLAYMLKLLDNPDVYTSETRAVGYDLTMAIYRSKNPVHVIAAMRRDCLAAYGLRQR